MPFSLRSWFLHVVGLQPGAGGGGGEPSPQWTALPDGCSGSALGWDKRCGVPLTEGTLGQLRGPFLTSALTFYTGMGQNVSSAQVAPMMVKPMWVCLNTPQGWGQWCSS